MDKRCSCIIPFYNEAKRTITVLSKLKDLQSIEKIILVNDWSTDKWWNYLADYINKNNIDNAEILSYTNNQWKAAAVKAWLDKVQTEYVLLFDADITNIKIQEIEDMIKQLYNDTQIDMWILRRISAKRYIKLFYRELILSGQRMMRTKDLQDIFHKKIEKYQLEIAINTYMTQQKKTTVRFPFTWENQFKQKKRGFRSGKKRDLLMFKDIIDYQGFWFFVKHMLSFKPTDIKKHKKQKVI